MSTAAPSTLELKLQLWRMLQRRTAAIPDLIAWAVRHLRHRLTTYDPDSPTLGLSAFHRDIASTCDRLTTERGQRECRLAPRGSAKTSWGTLAFPLREALAGREPYTIIVSDTQTNARKFLDNIKRECESNLALKDTYPNAAGVGPVWNQDLIRFRNGSEIEALSTGQNIRGRLSTTRPRLIVADDLQGRDDVVSKVTRERAWDWFVTDLLPLGEPETNIIVLGTPVHREAIVQKLRTQPGWNTVAYQALINPPDRVDLWDTWTNVLQDYSTPGGERRARKMYDANRADMDAGGEVLWPERFPLYDLMTKLVSDGSAAFGSEYQSNPSNPDLSEWPAEYFDDQARPEFWFDRWEDVTGIQVKTLYLDPSKGSKDRTGDYSAFVLFARDDAGKEYVEADLFRGSQHATVEGIVRKAVQYCRDFQPEAFGFEAVAFQQLLGHRMTEALRIAGLQTRLVEMVDNAPKDVRIRRLTTPLAQRRIRFRRTPGTRMLVDQLRDWPTVAFDDAADGMEGARRLAIELMNGRQRAGAAGPIQFRV